MGDVTVVQQISKVITVGDGGREVNVTQQVVKVVTVAEQGPPGPPGVSGEYITYISKIAGVNISGHRVVRVSGNDTVDYADKDSLSDINKVIGVTLGASAQNDPINIQTRGEIEDVSFNWDINKPIYLGNNGYLTQDFPTTGFLLQVAIPVSNTKINISLKQPILLG